MHTGGIKMERNAMARAKDFLTGLLVGGLAGAVAMWLLAPHSGKATRTRIQHRGIEFRDQVAEGVEDAEEQARATVHQVRKGLRHQVEELQQRGEALFDGQ
jgi:gas vesicle protein